MNIEREHTLLYGKAWEKAPVFGEEVASSEKEREKIGRNRSVTTSRVEGKFSKTDSLKAPQAGDALSGPYCVKKKKKVTAVRTQRQLRYKKDGKKRDARKELLITRRAQFAVAYN